MKQQLLILNVLLIFLGLLSCNAEKIAKENDIVEGELNPFFTSDSTVLYSLNVRKNKQFNDSILLANDFVNQYSKDSLIYFKYLDRGYYFKLKVNALTKSFQEKIENKMSELYAFSKSEKFWYGIQVYDGKPIQEIYLLKHPQEWEIKVFRRNRF